MSTKHVVTWRRYTAAEKKAYRARQQRRRASAQRIVWVNGQAVLVNRFELQRGTVDWFDEVPMSARERAARRRQKEARFREIHGAAGEHHFADNLGSRVPTQRVNGEYL